MPTKCWLLTWTTYGSWLPGDDRGFVTRVRDQEGESVIHNQYGTPCDAYMPGLRAYAQEIQRQTASFLDLPQAEALSDQLQQTARVRNWRLHSLAIMANHVHLIVEADEDVPSSKLLGDFKAYGTRRLRELAQRPTARFWTERGSTRLLTNQQALSAAIQYVQRQAHPLVIWTNPSVSEI